MTKPKKKLKVKKKSKGVPYKYLIFSMSEPSNDEFVSGIVELKDHLKNLLEEKFDNEVEEMMEDITIYEIKRTFNLDIEHAKVEFNLKEHK